MVSVSMTSLLSESSVTSLLSESSLSVLSMSSLLSMSVTAMLSMSSLLSVSMTTMLSMPTLLSVSTVLSEDSGDQDHEGEQCLRGAISQNTVNKIHYNPTINSGHAPSRTWPFWLVLRWSASLRMNWNWHWTVFSELMVHAVPFILAPTKCYSP